ncbi:L-arabinose isomerase, partial [Staphylococcus arlettae]
MAENKKFWFVVGSQALYGEEALDQVKSNAQDIANELNNKADLPFEIELQPQLATSADVITQIMKEANYR